MAIDRLGNASSVPQMTQRAYRAALCGAFHKLGGFTCIRPLGHDGHCWSKWEGAKLEGRTIQRGEWHSRTDGSWISHCAYRDLGRTVPDTFQRPDSLTGE